MNCEICGSDFKVMKYKRKILLCSKHRYQMYIHGKITLPEGRSRNPISYFDNHAEITLFDRNHNIRAYALISKNRVKDVIPYKWSLNRKGYVVAKVNGKSVLLHKFLLPVKYGMFVDHINRNKLDCRDENLREVTPSQNSHNSKVRRNNSSGHKNIRQEKSGKWCVEITFNYIRHRKAGINTLDEAFEILNRFKE